QVRVQATYLRLLLVPTGLAFVREADLYRSLTDIPVLLSATLHISLVAVAILMLRRSRNDAGNTFFLRTAAFGIFWLYVALLMESSIIPQDDLVLEHRLYFPAFGGLTALVSLFLMIRREYISAESAGGILVLAVCVLAVLTILRNEQWRDPLVFWQDNMAKSPSKTRIHGYIGNLYMNRGETSKALQEYKKAFSGDYRYGQDHYVLGNMFFEQNMYRDAVEEYLAALRIRPDKHEVYLNLAEAYRMLGENSLSEMAEQRFVEGRSASEKKR
ncbi:MAG: tetratricopeptide repeat protein, partial [Deltaproteobacteria bacterium]|nr:tetratricopeptide repeat protein [Deltaproteobacteria bacterium]